MSANIHVYFNYTTVFLNYFKNKVAKLMTTLKKAPLNIDQVNNIYFEIQY